MSAGLEWGSIIIDHVRCNNLSHHSSVRSWGFSKNFKSVGIIKNVNWMEHIIIPNVLQIYTIPNKFVAVKSERDLSLFA